MGKHALPIIMGIVGGALVATGIGAPAGAAVLGGGLGAGGIAAVSAGTIGAVAGGVVGGVELGKALEPGEIPQAPGAPPPVEQNSQTRRRTSTSGRRSGSVAQAVSNSTGSTTLGGVS